MPNQTVRQRNSSHYKPQRWQTIAQRNLFPQRRSSISFTPKRPTKFPTPVRPLRLKQLHRQTILGSVPSPRLDTSSIYALDIKTSTLQTVLSQLLSPMLEERREFFVSQHLQPMWTIPRTVLKALLQILHHPEIAMDAGNPHPLNLSTTLIYNDCKKPHLTKSATHPTQTILLASDHHPQLLNLPTHQPFKPISSIPAP